MRTATVNSVVRHADRRADLARRFTASALVTDSARTPDSAFRAWFEERRNTHQYEVNRIPFAELVGWDFEPDTGNLVHSSGRFFSVEGIHVTTDAGAIGSWMQPIINQPEIGVLGIVVKEFDGVLHCWLQAKMEPGNLNTVQLSPTVQATRSNYTAVHKGRAITHLEFFTGPRRGRVLVDSLQSEQGAWFLHKRNRNIVVEVTEELPDHPDFCWLTLGQIHRLMQEDNVLNMDLRTVLSTMPFTPPDGPRPGGAPGTGRRVRLRQALLRSMAAHAPSVHSTGDVLSWLTDVKATHEFVRRSVPLRQVEGWERTDDEIRHEAGKHFTIIASRVHATSREVRSWTQPLLAPVEQGLAALVVRPFDGVLHALVQAKVEGGVLDVAELAPTVLCLPVNYADLPADRQPRFLDLVRAAAPGQVVYDSVQSEEGGRFYHADNRYVIVAPGDEVPLQAPPGFSWLTVAQLTDLLAHGNYLNVQLRTLLAALHTCW
jgi:oxidase EvaA